MKRKIGLLFVIMAWSFSVIAVSAASYADVNEGDWYEPYVQDVSEKGLMTGYENGYFGPADELTRGQFATIIWRMEGAQAVVYDGKYPDVSAGDFYAQAAKWAGDNGIITGYDSGYFGGNDSITREQVATILSRYANKTGKEVTKGNIYEFPDGNSVSAFAKDGVVDAIGSGWIMGDNGLINPQGKVNRAVAATMISRYAAGSEMSNPSEPETPSEPEAGSRLNPLSAYDAYTTDIYSYGVYLGKFEIQLLDYKDGQEAWEYVSQNEYNSVPGESQEYIYVKYKITYLSGRDEVEATDVINYYSGFFNSEANYQLDNIDWAYDFEDVDGMVNVSLYPGGSATCSAAILVKTGNTPITYRLETGKSDFNRTFTWFTTKK